MNDDEAVESSRLQKRGRRDGSHAEADHCTSTFTVALSSTFGSVSVNTPSESLAVTREPSTGRGRYTVRVNAMLLVNTRSLEIWFGACCARVTALADEPIYDVLAPKAEAKRKHQAYLLLHHPQKGLRTPSRFPARGPEADPAAWTRCPRSSGCARPRRR